MGTQVWLDSKSGKMVHKAIFSMWDASKTVQTVGIGAGCGRFGGEGVGSHCLVDFPLVEGTRYTVKVALESVNATGATWIGTIADVAAKSTTTIGRLFYPNWHYKNGTAAQGYGLFAVNAAAFQEYFLSGAHCQGQAHSAIGLIGPFFHSRKTLPQQATPDYAKSSPPCDFVNVAGAVPGFGKGAPYVLLEAGGVTEKVNAAGKALW
jgi:hypothetical protein